MAFKAIEQLAWSITLGFTTEEKVNRELSEKVIKSRELLLSEPTLSTFTTWQPRSLLPSKIVVRSVEELERVLIELNTDLDTLMSMKWKTKEPKLEYTFYITELSQFYYLNLDSGKMLIRLPDSIACYTTACMMINKLGNMPVKSVSFIDIHDYSLDAHTLDMLDTNIIVLSHSPESKKRLNPKEFLNFNIKYDSKDERVATLTLKKKHLFM